MYGKNPSNSPLSAIQLWSDWNSQIHDWAKTITNIKNTGHAGPAGQKDTSFSYHVIHSEDLIDSSVDVRFAAISQLAEWVGSSKLEIFVYIVYVSVC